MAVTNGQEVEVLIEKPASGGRMIARHEGEILLVAGAIPGERVTAVVSRAEKRMAFADAVESTRGVTGPPRARRRSACGGCVYAIAYERQLRLKAEISAMRLRGSGGCRSTAAIEVAASPERGYRMRARFHVGDGRPGSSGKARTSSAMRGRPRQLFEAAIDAVEAAVAALAAQGIVVESVELAENMAGDQRALHLELAGSPRATRSTGPSRLRGSPAARRARPRARSMSAGDPVVCDPLPALTGGRAVDGGLRRHPEAFFQANRFLVPVAVAAVIDSVPPGRVLDLYAGVGLFSVGLAAAGRGHQAVEGDPVSGRDLVRNAAPFSRALRVTRGSVEAFLAAGRRTAASNGHRRPAADRHVEGGGGCDRPARGAGASSTCRAIPPTMARDAGGCWMRATGCVIARGFDLFPNTPHVETLGVFERIADERALDHEGRTAAELSGPPEVLRVPLDADAELGVRRLDRFDHAVGRRRRRRRDRCPSRPTDW